MDLDTTKFRFTLDEIQEADDLQFGFCLACGEVREGYEPDAEGYPCDVCGEPAVYGPHRIAICGLIVEDGA
jgi:hypothetical protein